MSTSRPYNESDEDVRGNISPSLVPLFDRVRSGIRASARQSRTEAFLQYVEDHPHEVNEAADLAAEFKLKAHVRPALDFYETPSWAIRCMVPHLRPLIKPGARILDPGCGTGAILREIGAQFPENEILGIEKDDARYLACQESTELPVVRGDFLLHTDKHDVIVSNPPYMIAFDFVSHALTVAPVVCMLLRLGWLAGQRRADWHRLNPCHVYVLPKRPSFTADGKTDATEYAWLVWGEPGGGGRYTILEIDPKSTKKRAR